MTVWVFAALKKDADRWVRLNGLRPRDCRTFGDRSRPDGMTFLACDRVVVLGEIGRRAAAVINRVRLKVRHPPEVEYLPVPPSPHPAS